MDTVNGADTKSNILVNYTTSIPSGFAKSMVETSKSKINQQHNNTQKLSESPKKEDRELNIIMNKNSFHNNTKHSNQYFLYLFDF